MTTCVGCGDPLAQALIDMGVDLHPNCRRPGPARCEHCDLTDMQAAEAAVAAGCTCEENCGTVGCKAAGVAVRSMLPALSGILARHQQGQSRSRQRTLGPSQIGVACDRRLAYHLAGVPELRPRGLMWAALLGTWAHAGLAEAMAQENARLGAERYLIEARVTTGYELVPGGSTDAYDSWLGEVIDWKVIGKSSMDKYRRSGPGPVYRVQPHTYGLGWERAGYPVRRVRVVFLPRWSHELRDGWEWVEPYNREVAVAALNRVDQIDRLQRQLGVADDSAALALIKADHSDCRYCPYFRATGQAASAHGCPGGAPAARPAASSTLAGI